MRKPRWLTLLMQSVRTIYPKVKFEVEPVSFFDESKAKGTYEARSCKWTFAMFKMNYLPGATSKHKRYYGEAIWEHGDDRVKLQLQGELAKAIWDLIEKRKEKAEKLAAKHCDG